MASHDRAFLDAVCTDLIDLDPAVDGPVRYGGGYTAYLAAKRAERERWQRRYAEEQEELAELRRAAAVTAHQVAPGRGRATTRRWATGTPPAGCSSRSPAGCATPPAGWTSWSATQVREPPAAAALPRARAGRRRPRRTACWSRCGTCGCPAGSRWTRLDVPATDRLLVTGANGAGKSTLLAVLAGRLAAAGRCGGGAA